LSPVRQRLIVAAFGVLALPAGTSLTLAQDGHPLSGRLRCFFQETVGDFGVSQPTYRAFAVETTGFQAKLELRV